MLEAMKITEETYDAYLLLPAIAHYDLNVVDTHYLVKNDETREWSWMPNAVFKETFEFIGTETANEFVEVINI